jgi:hypothetical protein
LKYRARTGGSGRGFAKADLVVYDEAQHLQGEHVAASGPARLSNPNSQSWYAGSGGLSTSLVAWRMRRRALRGDAGRLAYVENTAELVVDGRLSAERPDPYDRDAWARANPGYGYWVTEEALEGLFDELGEGLFARECMNVWDPCVEDDESGGVIPLDVWAELVDPESQIASSRCVALDVSLDRRWASFGGAGRRADGLFHVDAFDTRAGTDWVVDAGVRLWEHLRVPVRIEKGSPAGSFIAPLREQGVDVVEVTAQKHAHAVGQLLTAVEGRMVRHLGGSALNAAVRGADLRSSGDVELWARRSPRVSITPLVAVTLALGGVPDDGQVVVDDLIR